MNPLSLLLDGRTGMRQQRLFQRSHFPAQWHGRGLTPRMRAGQPRARALTQQVCLFIRGRAEGRRAKEIRRLEGLPSANEGVRPSGVQGSCLGLQ